MIATTASPGLIPGETYQQRAQRIAARDRVSQRMARVQIAAARLQALGLAVQNIDASTDRPILTIAASWRCGQLSGAWTVKTEASHALRQADLHGCRVQWRESLTRAALLSAA